MVSHGYIYAHPSAASNDVNMGENITIVNYIYPQQLKTQPTSLYTTIQPDGAPKFCIFSLSLIPHFIQL